MESGAERIAQVSIGPIERLLDARASHPLEDDAGGTPVHLESTVNAKRSAIALAAMS